jgi:hypothetical protein
MVEHVSFKKRFAIVLPGCMPPFKKNMDKHEEKG